jgi:serine protease AprX
MLCALGAAAAAAGAPASSHTAKTPNLKAFVQPSLLEAAQQDASQTFDVIVQGDRRDRAANLLRRLRQDDGATLDVRRRFRSLDGVQATLTGAQVLRLSRSKHVTAVLANEPVTKTDVNLPRSNNGKWAWAAHVPVDWTTPALALDTPTIAVVDSGIDADRSDFGGRVLGQIEIRSGSRPDGYGHGTFVAGIAAGAAQGRAGVAPAANLLSVRVMNDEGESTTADVVAACDWILAHRTEYDIRVVNLSLHATGPASIFFDPLDQAVERLWLNGIVVVAAAGNYAQNGERSDVPFAPGNDPFVITVGASDIEDTLDPSDDVAAPFSAWGYTLDGFAKPDLAAPGRYLVGPVPAESTLAAERPDHVLGNDAMQLSGTSFSAPAVAGTAALILARHPDWTPGQVKGALVGTATATPAAVPQSLGAGQLDVAAARSAVDPPDADAALDRFVVLDDSGLPVFDSEAWQTEASTNAAWGDATWSDAAWASAAWGDAAWGDAAWGDAAWGDAAWGDRADESLPSLPATPVTEGEREAVLAALGVTGPACDPTAGSCASP